MSSNWLLITKWSLILLKPRKLFSASKFEAFPCSFCALWYWASRPNQCKAIGRYLEVKPYSFNEHVTFLNAAVSVLILKLLRDQGMPQIHLDTVFHAHIMSKKIWYDLCAWGCFLAQMQKQMIDACLCRMYTVFQKNVTFLLLWKLG